MGSAPRRPSEPLRPPLSPATAQAPAPERLQSSRSSAWPEAGRRAWKWVFKPLSLPPLYALSLSAGGSRTKRMCLGGGSGGPRGLPSKPQPCTPRAALQCSRSFFTFSANRFVGFLVPGGISASGWSECRLSPKCFSASPSPEFRAGPTQLSYVDCNAAPPGDRQ